jgi:MFS family permease
MIRPNIQKSKVNKIIFLLYMAILSILTSGIIFGWPSLLSVFIEEGIYKEYCKNKDVKPQFKKKKKCSERDFKFSIIFSFGSFSMCIGQLFLGFLLDFWGPRNHFLMGSTLFSIGCLFFSFSSCFFYF